MDGLSNLTEILHQFQSPIRVLLPKILKSRDDWKDKCQRRRAQNKTLTIKIRDLTASRETWRAKHVSLLAEQQKLQSERDQFQIEREQLRQQLQVAEQELADLKKS